MVGSRFGGVIDEGSIVLEVVVNVRGWLGVMSGRHDKEREAHRWKGCVG